MDRPGGVINSVSENGFLYETGPNTGVLSTPEMAMLFRDLDGKCTLEPANPTAKSRWIWKGNSWVPLPGGLLQAVTTPLFTFGDKLRILGEPFRRRGTDPFESVASLVRRRMGKSYLDYAVDPFISGIYAGNPELLVTKYALPKLYNLEMQYGSFIRGGFSKSFAKKTETEAMATREVFSAEGGLSTITTALANAIGEESIILSCKDPVCEMKDKKYITTFKKDGAETSVESDYLVTTCGSHSLGSLLKFADEQDLKAITSLEYAKVVQVILGYHTWNGKPLNGFGGLVPSKEGRDILGVLFTSSFLKNRAPKDGALLSVFMGGARKPEIIEKSDDEIIGIALHETGQMLDSKGARPDLIKVFRYFQAIPQYTRSSESRLAAIGDLETRHPGLILAGNIRDGIGMADRVKQGVGIAGGIR
jgi:oxygen-dependent protoporphyrinogen oxidase